ncbi:MAG: hypothetical protein MN733_03235 [Nitrososphaera sp.]|nr:hypothetical protein [Nitrososphaera sp.]
MDPMTMALIAQLGLEGAQLALNQGQGGDSEDLQRQALRQARFDSNRMYRTATATRTDPYGNKLIYTPGIGWHYDLTDMTRGTLAAEQGEQLKNLTEDAIRNRQFRERMEGVSRAGEGEFYRTLNEYKYGPRADEASTISDLTRELLLARGRGLDQGKSILARQALRLGRGGDITKILRGANELFGDTLEEAVLRGRRLGKSEYQQRRAADTSDILKRLGSFENTARGQPQASISKSGLYSALSNQQQNAAAGVQGALSSGANLTQNAYSNLATASKPTPIDLGGVSTLIGKLGGQFQGSANPGLYGADNPDTWTGVVKPNPLYGTEEDINWYF